MRKYRCDANKEKYYDIADMVNKSDVPIIYSNRCRADQLQVEKIISSKNVMKYGLNSFHHGVVVCKCNLPVLLNMGVDQLKGENLVKHDR